MISQCILLEPYYVMPSWVPVRSPSLNSKVSKVSEITWRFWGRFFAFCEILVYALSSAPHLSTSVVPSRVESLSEKHPPSLIPMLSRHRLLACALSQSHYLSSSLPLSTRLLLPRLRGRREWQREEREEERGRGIDGMV